MSTPNISSASNITRNGFEKLDFTWNGKTLEVTTSLHSQSGNISAINIDVVSRDASTRELQSVTIAERTFAGQVWMSQLTDEEKQQYGLYDDKPRLHVFQ